MSPNVNDKNDEWVSLEIAVYDPPESFRTTAAIYMIRNKKNGNAYIGKTTARVYERLRSHVYDAMKRTHRGYRLHKAIKKYGLKSFETTVLAQACDETILNELEVSLIAEHETFVNGYNMTLGGEGVPGRKVSQHMRDRIKESNRTRNISKETRARMSRNRKGKPCNNKTKRAISKPVLQIDKETNDVVARFESIVAAKRATKINNISAACMKEQSTAGGYYWKFVNPNDANKGKWSPNDPRRTMLREKRSQICKPVEQIDPKTGNVIATYDSLIAATKATGILAITKVCCGKHKTAGGFIWRHAKQDES